MSDVTPIRPTVPVRGHVTVQPGQTSEDAIWHAGWDACAAQLALARSRALEMGYRQGLTAGSGVGPTWINLAVCSCFAFILGFTLAVAFFA